MEPKVERHVLLRLIKALNSNEELPVVATIASADSGLTAHILKFVNSAYFGLKREITSVEDAVAFLGQKKLKELAFILLTSSLLTTKGKEEIFKSLLLAYSAKELAKKRLPHLKDEAFLAGVLYPAYKAANGELLKMLEEAGVAKEIVEALKDGKSPLGLLLRAALSLIPHCTEATKGELPNVPEDKRELIVETCLKAAAEAKKVIELL